MKTRTLSIAIPVISGLVAAAAAMAQPVQLVTPAPVQYGQSTVVIAPNAPPPPRVETIPQPPSAEAQVMYWQPGHWGVGVGPVRPEAGAAGGLAAGPLGAAAVGRLCLGGRTLAGLMREVGNASHP